MSTARLLRSTNPAPARAAAATAAWNASESLMNAKIVRTVITRMADDISKTLDPENATVLLTVQPNGNHFANTLARKLDKLNFPVQENYIDMRLIDGKLALNVEPTINLKGRTILIAINALTDGVLLDAVIQYCMLHHASQVYCATLVNHTPARKSSLAALQPNFCGFEGNPEHLAGFGFDIDGFFANERSIKAIRGSTPLATSTTVSAREPIAKNEEVAAETAEAKGNLAAVRNIVNTLDIVLTKKQVKAGIKKAAGELEKRLKDKAPIILTMQKGGSHFSTYLMEQISGIAFEEAYMHMSRYGSSHHGGNIKTLATPSLSLEGRNVVICDDLIEGGLTIAAAVEYCKSHGAAEVIVVTLGDKPHKRIAGCEGVKPDIVCFQFDSRFLVGTGLDEKDYHRNKFGMWAFPSVEAPKAAAIEQAEKTELAALSNNTLSI